MKKIDLVDAIIKDNVESNLDILLNVPVPPNPSELISSKAMKELINKLDQMHDYVIIDTPPVGIITDAAILSTVAHGVLLVVRTRYTNKAMISNAISNIKNVNGKILGTILTYVKAEGSAYGGYYRYYGEK